MKKRYLSLGLVLGLAFSTSFLGLMASCDNGENKKPVVPEVTVRSYLSVDSSDVRVNYIEGETFDPSGLVVKKITETDGVKTDEQVLQDGTYTLSIPAETVLKTTDSEVVVSVADGNVQPGSFKIRVSEKLPTILERIEAIQHSEGYKAVISGEVTTRSVVFDAGGNPSFQNVTHDIERVFEFSPRGYSSSYTYVDLDGTVQEIYTYLINLGTKEEPKGVAIYENDLDSGELIALGAIKPEVLGNYQETMFDFGTFLTTSAENPNQERIEALSKSRYIFDLSVDSTGEQNNPYDAINAQILGKAMQLGSLADCITGIQMDTTKRGFEYRITLENTNPEYDTPVNGALTVQIVEANISEHEDLYTNLVAQPMPFRKVEPNFQRLLDLQKNNTYSLRIENEAQGTVPALNLDLTFGTDYFALSVETADEKAELLDGFIAKIEEDGSVVQAQFVPVDKDKPDGESVFKRNGVFTPEMITNLGLSSPYDLLEVFAMSNTGGIGFLRNRPEFNELGSLFTSPLVPAFTGQPPCFIVFDKFGYLGINEFLDYTSATMPISYTDPMQIAGSLIFWDEKTSTTIADDEVKCGMIQNNNLGGWMPISYSRFGVESPILELYNNLPPEPDTPEVQPGA